MTTMDGQDLQRLWSLIDDLTNQLQANRQLCESLQQQADQLRGQALHSGTGFALRRFNTDVSKEQFESELEALNVHLVKEHLMISHENKQQAMLLREYENTLETIMAKFRTFSHSTQQHTLRLTQHYETLLANTNHAAADQTLAAETAFSGTLTQLGSLVRRAMQSLDGEDDQEELDEKHADARWYGSGGYTGKTNDPIAQRAERALEDLTEYERLRMENETLRELLLLKDKSDALSSTAPASVAETVKPSLQTLAVPTKATSPASSPVLSPKQDKILEQAILADETDNSSSAVVDDDETAASREAIASIATEDVDAIHAEFQPDTDTAPVSLLPPTSPNLTAEAGPPALVSTGLEDTTASTTSETSVSGPSLDDTTLPEPEATLETISTQKDTPPSVISAEPSEKDTLTNTDAKST